MALTEREKQAEEVYTMIDARMLRDALAYNPETGEFHWRISHHRIAVGDLAGQRHPRGYWMITINQKRYLAHRLAWLYVSGSWPANDVDHINGDRMDNRIANLRAATRAENIRYAGKRSTNTTGFKGVSLRENGRYRAVIMKDGKQRSLGHFDTPQEAHAAYAAAAHDMFGEFAKAA